MDWQIILLPGRIQPKGVFLKKYELHKRISEKEKIYNKVFLPALPDPAVARTIGAAATAPTPAGAATPAAFRIRSPKKLQNVISSYFVTKQKVIIFFSVICVSWNEIKKNTGFLGTIDQLFFERGQVKRYYLWREKQDIIKSNGETGQNPKICFTFNILGT